MGKFRYTSFEGSSLINSNFKEALFHSVNFSHSNLEGADFTGATFTGNVFWGQCICPDGTNSVDHEYTCEDNLNPRRVEGISTDAPPNSEEYKNRLLIEGIQEVE